MAKGQAQEEKKEFAWDSEVGIGSYDASEKERHFVSICTLKGTLFLVDTKMVNRQATGWTPVKNTSIRLDNMERIIEIFTEWKFGSDSGLSVTLGTEDKPKRGKKGAK
jgi:hypothetical protein